MEDETPYTTSQGTNTIRLVASDKLYIDWFNIIKGPAIITNTYDANPIGPTTFHVGHNPTLSSAEIILILEKSEAIHLELMPVASGTSYNIYEGRCTYGEHIFHLTDIMNMQQAFISCTYILHKGRSQRS